MRKKRNGKKLRSALAILLAGSMMLGMVPGGMGQVYAADAETPVKEEQTGLLGKAKDFFSDMGEGIADFFTGGSAEAEPAAAFDEKAVADPSTVYTWKDIVKDTTENIGRIWTDKTVLTGDIKLDGGNEPSVKKGDSDFLVGLSALSSTSNTVETVSRPLDIVLVVDTSGSMVNPPHMGTRPDSERYKEIYADKLNKTWNQVYYTKDGDRITSEWEGWRFTHWELNGQNVEPKTSADDSNPDHIQFYKDLGENITKLEALQDAVNNFVKQTAQMNDSITDVNLQHRVSLVKFASDENNSIGNSLTSAGYNCSQIVTELKPYTTKNVSNLTSTVNDLTASGVTRADYGLNQAQIAFQHGGTREGAQKVVVFFTDGQPTSGSEWSNSVAANAITNAKALKDANTLIYSIGVFQDANPNDTKTNAGNFNGYMHAVSSNYPYATATGSYMQYSCTLNDRADKSNYYKAAKDATELNNIFDEISDDLETGLGFPTQTPTQGYDPGKVGYITFTDQLGEYMQVDEFKSLVFADQIFDPVGDPVTKDGVTTYKYEGSATGDSELYPSGNVSDIIVQVNKGADLKTGDTVTVRIPAGLIPLRHFTVDTDNDGNKTMKIKEAYPLCIFYGVSIKPKVQEKIADGLNPDDADDEALQKYMNDHNEAGAAQFYSNYYNGQYTDPNGKKLGNTIASFQPSKKNTFYYFTEDTPIYTDEKCTIPVTGEPSANTTYYYKRPYVELTGDGVVDVPANVEVAGANFQYASENFDKNSNGEYYIKSGSARLTRVDALKDDKTHNTTNTAEVVIDPIWDNVNNPDYLNVYLGNNGRLDLELPGALAISKDARVAANKNLDADEILKDKQFTFQISIPSMKEKTVKAEVRNEQNEIQGTTFDLTFNREGIAEHQIKNDETLYIHGLDKDAAYTVQEDADSMAQGFALTSVDGKQKTNATGTIEAGVPKSHTFTNTYDVKSITVDTDANANVKLTKQLTGRNWKATDQFNFTIAAKSPENAPMPMKDGEQKTEASVTQPEGTTEDTIVRFGFGTITFDQPGTYYYEVTEENEGQTLNGITYDKTPASIQITVQDPGDGQLTAEVTAYNADFVNTYTASLAHNAAGGIVTTKTLTGHDMEAEQFTFQVEALAGKETTAEENAKRIGIQDGKTGTYRNDRPANDGETLTMKTDDGKDIQFTAEDIGKTFKYKFSEKGAEGQFGAGGTKDGYTYDKAVYTVELWVTDDGDGTLTLHTKVTDKDGMVTEETSTEKEPKETRLDFTNRYAASGILNGTENLAGTKKMDGPWEATGKDLSGFQFTITGGDEETNAAIAAGTVELPQKKTVTSEENGSFNFDDITFNKKGTYQFKVSEVVPEDDKKIPGVTYNAAPVTITVTVTDNNDGTLTAALAKGSPELTFTNTYATTQDATFIPSVVKKVEGLDAKENFTFKLSAADDATKRAIADKTITGIGTVADPYSAEKTTLTLIQKGKTERVDFNALTFKKAGTYKFTVEETNASAPTGWTYDGHTYEITIKVTDDNSKLRANQDLNSNGLTNSSIFTNSFAATTTYGEEGGLNVTKTLNGRTLAADMFEFTITGVKTDTVTAEEANEKLDKTDKNFTNTAPGEDGVAVMSKLGAAQFDETDIEKTYQYAVQEIAGTDTKYTYDNVSATVAIQVMEKDGELYTVTTVTKGGDVKTYSSIDGSATAVVPFVNSYTPDIVTVEPGKFAGPVTKVLKGNRGAELAAGEFNFQMTITPADETSSMDHVVLPEGASDGTVTAANAANGLVSFGNIQFKAAGNYHVAISEVIPEPADPNMTYDKRTFSYDIVVTYNAAEGTLSAAVVEGSTEGNATFTNIYEADDAKDVANTKEPTTSVNGKIVGVGDQLTYTIDWVNNAVDETGIPVKAEVTITDEVPEGTKYVSAENGGAYDQENNTITWTLGEQEVGASGTVSFVVEVLDIAGGTDVTNKANITVGNNDSKQTNEVTTNVPGKKSEVEGDGELQIGKVLTYTISYKNPEAEAATVKIEDIIPVGLDYVEGSASNGATYKEEDRTLTWTLSDVQPETEGKVTFDAKVNESAETVIDNKATIQIGDNAPTYDTNTDQNEIPKDGNLAISKTIALTEGQGTVIDTEKAFEFTVALTDSAGVPLTKEYAYTIGNKDGKVTHNGKILLKDGETAKITGLPAGTKFTVTETAAAGYTTSPENGVITGSVTAEQTAKADFTNTYSVTGNLIGAESLKVTKNFTGREGNQWLERDAFTFTLTAADDEATKAAIEADLIKLPETTEITIDGTMAEKQAAFGDIQFTIAGTFKFHVTEQPSGIAGITDDKKAERTVVVNVTDEKDGTLEAVVVKGKSDNLTFTNTYGAGSGENDIAAKISATKELTGRDMQAGEFDFEVVTRKTPEYTGNFTPVVVATGTNVAGADGEAARVTFAGSDANGAKALNYTTKSLNKAVEAGYAVKEGNVWTVNYTAREKTDSLPNGVKPVAEKTEFNFTIVVTDKTDGTLTAEVQYPNGAITFENTYATGGTIVDTDPTDANAFFYKVLEGRDWLEKDAFTFTIEPQDGAPAPINAEGNPVTTVTVTKADLKDGKAPFGFGKIHFTDANMGTASEKTFMYHVKENDIDAEAMPGVSKDTHIAKFSITLTDDGEGTLSAATPVVTDGIFTNRYESSLDYNAVGGLQISKVLNGRDMQKDQFTFTLTPKATEGSTTAEEAAKKLGFAEVKAYEFKNEVAAMGEATYMNVLSGKEVVFTQADAGKTYTYEIVEVKGQNEAYTYDTDVRTVTINVKDNNNGTLTVVTTVKKGEAVVDEQTVITGQAGQKATVAFENTYNDNPATLGGEGEVSIHAMKSLTNRPMEADEFTFNVQDNIPGEEKPVVVTTGTNGSDGTIRFGAIEYTTDKLIADAKAGIATVDKNTSYPAYVYTYDYDVVEDERNFVDGVTGITKAFAIEVVVTDDGNGNLNIEVVYPEGMEELLFENAYGTGAEAEINVNGSKKLVVESGNNAPDITGKYTFTLSGSDGAPMPEKATANNDAAGNVDFGKITYTMQNVFGDKGVTAEAEGTEEALTEVMPVSDTRTKTFTYTVTESGTVEGVTNDAESVKTFNVTVTDNGDGTIKVDKDYTGFEFGFTNTYHVEPVDFDINGAEAGITVKKELTGRAMNAGEFVFELISDKDKSVREAVNDTDGNVKFETMNFTAPGEYIYTLRERNTKLGGVDYDTTEYQVVVTVTDNGDGTMSAEAKLADEGKDVVFKNQYEAAPTSVMFGASKIYKGADLKDGQFTFVVKDADGNVVSEAKNNKDGMVTFDTIEFNEKGTYTFTISEKNDKQKNVTYDKAVYEVTVTVTDNGEGSLIAEVAYADGKAPVFTNKYTKPAEPSKPEEPKKPGAVQTGDSTPIVGLVVAMVVALAAIVAVAVIFFRRRRR